MSVSAPSLPVTERTRLRRLPARGVFDRAAIHRILDEGLVCHLAFVVDGQPYAMPATYGRAGDVLYVHGSAVSRMIRTLGSGVDACATVTILDGLVLARSAFHHSMNYRSVVVLGRARAVSDPAEKAAALRAITTHVVPGRWDDLRPMSDREVAATAVLALPIEEASAKMRSGPPGDDKDDVTWPAWAGVIPLSIQAGEPVPDEHVRPGSVPYRFSRPARQDEGI